MRRMTHSIPGHGDALRLCLLPVVVVSLLFVGATVADAKDKAKDAAKGAAKDQAAKTEAPAADVPAGFVADTNAPGVYGESGYLSWGTNGGATLGHGSGVRANFVAGQRQSLGTGYGSLEAYYIIGMGPDFDVLVGGRVGLWWFGIAPGARLRIRFMGGPTDAFHLAFDGGAYVGFAFLTAFGGVGGGFAFAGGTTIDPGIAGSYFVKDNMEIYFGAFVPLTVAGGPMFSVGLGFDFRGGFAFTLKKMNLGFFAQVDLIPTLTFHDRVGLSTPLLNFNGSGTGGVQWRF